MWKSPIHNIFDIFRRSLIYRSPSEISLFKRTLMYRRLCDRPLHTPSLIYRRFHVSVLIITDSAHSLLQKMTCNYGVAMISRLPKNIGLFDKRALWKRLYSAKETYILKELTNHSHDIKAFYRSSPLCRVAGSFKLQVSFAEYSLFHRALFIKWSGWQFDCEWRIRTLGFRVLKFWGLGVVLRGQALPFGLDYILVLHDVAQFSRYVLCWVTSPCVCVCVCDWVCVFVCWCVCVCVRGILFGTNS